MRLKCTVSAVLAALTLIGTPGCRRGEREFESVKIIEKPEIAAVLHMGDQERAGQLISGFHDLEENAWRWTQGKFSVLLRSPRRAAERGARLFLRFTLPPPIIERLKTITISATVAGTSLPPQTYSTPGEQTYLQDVPAVAFREPSVRVDFALDKTYTPGGADERQLGVIATSIGFEPKLE